MLELKDYQKKVLEVLKLYIERIKELDDPDLAFYKLLRRQYKPLPSLEKVPFICIKAPTGAGKTLIASHAVETIYRNYLPLKDGKGLVIWLAPSDIIESQTLKKLKDRYHPYREVLDSAFDGRVQVFSKEEALRLTKNDVENYLSIIVAQINSFRREKTEYLKVFQDNGYLMTFFQDNPALERNRDILDGDNSYIINSLVNVIKMQNPLVVVDEGHNVQTDLSLEMLKNINPSFVIEYTATPKGHSNVLESVSSLDLKNNDMVKIPIYLYLIEDWKITLEAAKEKREQLEELTQKEKEKTGEYIRPLLLIQAEQEKESPDKITVSKVKKFLIENLEIPKNQIAIKTAKQDELKDKKLESEDIIRYIVTIRALREGWDCSFAYILAAISNQRAPIAVEQTLGRILRLPNVKPKTTEDLNCSYVFTSSPDTKETLDKIISALSQNGYEQGDYRIRKSGEKEKPEKTYFDKVIDDEDIKIPYLSVKKNGEIRKLELVRDLLSGFDITAQNIEVEEEFEKLLMQEYKIDITAKGVEPIFIKLKEIEKVPKELFPAEDLTNWLGRRVRRVYIPFTKMKEYISRVVEKLLENKSLAIEQLFYYKFVLLSAIDKKVSHTIREYARKKFDEYMENNQLSAKAHSFETKDMIEIFLQSDETFNRHLYERAYRMNEEELEVARKIDRLENVKWWLRNAERKGFDINGWIKFYPDFIVKTNKGNYIIIEYKGSDRPPERDEDSKDKECIGKEWQKLAGENYFFKMIGEDEINETIKFIKSK